MYSAVLVCGGSGSRTGLNYNKLFLKIEGITVFEKSIQLFIEDEKCNEIIVVCKESEKSLFQSLCLDTKVKYCMGGLERLHSVYNGLQYVTNDKVLIHDGARPFLSKQCLERVVEAALQYKACSLMVPCIDTVKEVKNNMVIRTLDRAKLMMVQTPQAFDTKLIKECYQDAIESSTHVTDDCSVVEMFSEEQVKCVLGDYENIKITTKEDVDRITM